MKCYCFWWCSLYCEQLCYTLVVELLTKCDMRQLAVRAQYIMGNRIVHKDQTAQTVARVLYERFIAVFGAPAKILSNHGANFTSTLVEELCTAFNIQKCRMTAYHTQCNGQVEHFHQTLFCTIRKLASDKKAHWEQHLPELVQAYNSTWSVVTGYSLHYLMFGRHLHLPIDFYFLTMSTHVHACHVPACVVKVRKHFKEAYMGAHSWTNNEAE